ncbi:MAG: class IIb bacteriocin, lactobin A/cerein 7B family [Cruoricaptor ignavus]|nr:class IIb bacteriocin, lactobin A/cerein 7B family [Cruoricaptor ignavus]
MKKTTLKQKKLKELSYNEAVQIEGGVIPLAAAWGIAKIFAAVGAGAYATGYAIGKFHAHSENNK